MPINEKNCCGKFGLERFSRKIISELYLMEELGHDFHSCFGQHSYGDDCRWITVRICFGKFDIVSRAIVHLYFTIAVD